MSVSDMARFPGRIVRFQGVERAGSKIEHVAKHRKCIVLFLNAIGGLPEYRFMETYCLLRRQFYSCVAG
jgi:predicted fused transcriptional regulator/phosphomethylpyrimidine kinase